MAIVDRIASGFGAISKSRPMIKLAESFKKDPEKALALTTVGSIIAKDGIGCAMYVTQSLNNKKIPDEKRKFVAALDLTNGVLMIAAQIAMFFAMRKYSGPIFEKIFKKSFNEASKSDTISRIRMKMAKSGEEVAKKLKLAKEYDEVKKSALDVFKFILDISAATIIGKRVIVPLIATPLAKKVQVKMEEHSAEKNGQKPAFEGEKPVNEKAELQAPKLDIVSTSDEDTNLLNRYQKYYGAIKMDPQ